MNPEADALLKDRLRSSIVPGYYIELLATASEDADSPEEAIAIADRMYQQHPYGVPTDQDEVDEFISGLDKPLGQPELTRVGGQPAILADAEMPQDQVMAFAARELGQDVSLEPVQARTDGRALYRIKPR